MFFGKKDRKKDRAQSPAGGYDPASQEPVLRCSICNGEQVAGFRDKTTGAFPCEDRPRLWFQSSRIR